MNKILLNVVLLFSMVAYAQSSKAQACNFSCVDHVYLGLDTACEYLVTISDVVKDTTGCSGAILELYDPYGQPLPNPLTGNQRGLLITYKVIGADYNACWGNLTVEDKWARMINCQNDTLNCWDAEEFINATPTRDNCGYGLQFEELHRIWVDYNCDSADFIGYIERSVISMDVWGNSSRCDSQRIYIIRESLDSLVCPEDPVEIACCETRRDPTSLLPVSVLWDPSYAYEDAEGYSHPIPKPGGLVEPPYIRTPDGDRHYVGSTTNSLGGVNNGKCNIIAEYKDHIVPTCGPTYKIRREWKLFDWCTGEDTICVQWIKIVDNEAPVVFFGPEFTPIIVAYTQPHECVAHVELGWPTIYNDCAIKAAKGDVVKAFKDFKVRYEMEWFDQDHPGKVIVRSGEIPFGAKVTEYVPKSGLLFIQPEIKVKYYVTDGCWNEARVCQTILVYDNEPPTPVCDEITQVTLDPDSCWVRIYAEDLDDGSHDNCDEVHFAVAKMEDIEYWRDYWHDALHECYLKYHYASEVIDRIIDEWIDLYVFESYIDLEECGRDSLVMRVYEDLGTPPYDPHKFRGSEHQWYNWYRAPILRYSSYRCNYVFYYDSLGHYNEPIHPEITCDEIEFAIVLEELENGIVDVLDALNRFDFVEIAEILGDPIAEDPNEFIQLLFSISCENPFIDEDDGENILEEITCFELTDLLGEIELDDDFIDTSAQFIVEVLTQILEEEGPLIITPGNIGGLNPALLDGDITMFSPITTAQSISGPVSLLEFINIIYYFICYNDDLDMKIQVFENLAKYPELLAFVIEEKNLVNLAYSGIFRKRFLDLPYYNDCMIEVIKDDKTPPVCYAPADVSYYCDGVPVVGSIFPNGGNDEVKWTSARFAHDICAESDIFLAGCEFDRTDDGASVYNAPDHSPWCVDAPWDGGVHGYYGGPIDDSYDYEDPCDENLAAWYPDDNYTWKPIYCRFWLMLDKYDTEGDGKPDPYAYFGEPEYYDNCWLPEITEVTEGELDECGVGYLTRTWTVTDKCGNSSTCYQRITIKPRSDFEVKFPADKYVNCDELEDLSPIENDPETYPVVTDDDCELIGITYSDQVIDIEQDGCFKILRTWKVIDWCVFTPDLHNRYPDVIVDDRCTADPDNRPCVIRNLKDDGDGFMIYLQVIKVIDDVAPEVVCNNGSTFCIWNEECDDLYIEYELGNATDNCTEALQYRYAVNPNGDSPETDWIFGHGNILQNTLPVGKHTVILYAKDDCGNEGYCELEIVVEDCKPPTPYCYDGIATVIMPSSGEVTIWAKDFDAGSFDNCTEKDSLEFSFTDIEVRPSMTFTCEDIPGGDMTRITLVIWVKDEAGNQDFCQTYILLQDGSGDVCGDRSSSLFISNNSADVKSTKGAKRRPTQFLQSPLKEGDILLDGIVLKQNRPNPYQNNTLIEFDIEKTQDLTLQVVDISGKVILQQKGIFHAGINQWKIHKDQLNISSGILYYQVISNQVVLTKKMVLIE